MFKLFLWFRTFAFDFQRKAVDESEKDVRDVSPDTLDETCVDVKGNQKKGTQSHPRLDASSRQHTHTLRTSELLKTRWSIVML